MKFYLFVILFSVLISCKSENNSKEKDSLESNKRNIDLYITGEKFETKKADKLNLEGIELSKKSEYKKAEKIFLNALEIEPNNPTILNNLGNVKDYQNKYEESIKYYEKSLLVSDSLYLNAGLNIGVISYKTKNYNKSLNLL